MIGHVLEIAKLLIECMIQVVEGHRYIQEGVVSRSEVTIEGGKIFTVVLLFSSRNVENREFMSTGIKGRCS